MMISEGFIPFLIRAKRNTYASGIAPSYSSRPCSHDLQYAESPFLYIDTYLGGIHFIGEEAVWENGVNIWGMNYYGKMLTDRIPEGFSPFLKTSMRQVSPDAPYRGPAQFGQGDFIYHCSWSGSLIQFEGEELIHWKEKPIYHLVYHGGEIQD
jgi:hypothetical protein